MHIYWNHLKYLNASKKLEARKHRKQNQMIRFWFFAIWFRSFPIPQATGDCNTYSISSLGNHLADLIRRIFQGRYQNGCGWTLQTGDRSKGITGHDWVSQSLPGYILWDYFYSLHCWLLLNYIGDGLPSIKVSQVDNWRKVYRMVPYFY